MNSPCQTGFTLIEVLVVIAIAALLLAIGLPNLRPEVAATDAKTAAQAMTDALQLARQYALNTSTVATFTPNGCGYTVTRADGTQLVPSPTTGSDVTCAAFPVALTFLGDGSVSTCTAGASGTTCSPLALPAGATTNQHVTATVQASTGGVVWRITVTSGGQITEAIQ